MPEASCSYERVETTSKLDWLDKRRAGITATDTPQILGLSPWGTALHVYTEKIEPAVEVPWGDLDRRLRWGLRLEDDLIAEYLMETGCALAEVQYTPLLRSKTYPWMLYSPDALIVPPERKDRPLELKVAAREERWGPANSDEVPAYYYTQVVHQLVVMNAPWGELAVLIGNEDFRIFHIEPTKLVRAEVIEAAAQFWDRVERRDDPDPDWTHPKTVELLSHMYGVDESITINLGEDCLRLAQQHKEMGDSIHAAERERDAIKARLLDAMGDAANARLPQGWELTRQTVNRRGFETKPTSYTKFGVKGPKQ